MNKESIVVIVITYNSEKWILETLESIKNQTYSKLELIISDDNSIDRTVELTKKWVIKNGEYFENIKILVSVSNQGVVRNINQAIKATTSEWIKLIAGDDILLEDCIQKNIEYSKKNNFNNLFSKVIKFKDELKNENIIKEDSIKDNINYIKFCKSAKEQFKELCKENFVYAPTSFFKKKLIEEMDYFDETYPMIEDYPMWLKLTDKGIKLNFLDIPTVYYRIHSSSISNIEGVVVNEKVFEFRNKIYTEYIREKIKNPLFHYREKLNYLRNKTIIKNGNKKRYTPITVITYIVDPYIYIKVLRKIIKTI